MAKDKKQATPPDHRLMVDTDAGIAIRTKPPTTRPQITVLKASTNQTAAPAEGDA